MTEPTISEVRSIAADERTKLVKELLAKESAANDAKTARLKADRLAKEAAATQPHILSKRTKISKDHRKIWAKLDSGPRA